MNDFARLMQAPEMLLASIPSITGTVLVDGIISTVVYSLVGMVMAFISFRVIDALTPGDLAEEIGQKHNLALAIFASSMILGICIIIAAAVVG